MCKEFPALDPFSLEEKPFHGVILLYGDVIKTKQTETSRKDPDRVIRKPAGDDWF